MKGPYVSDADRRLQSWRTAPDSCLRPRSRSTLPSTMMALPPATDTSRLPAAPLRVDSPPTATPTKARSTRSSSTRRAIPSAHPTPTPTLPRGTSAASTTSALTPARAGSPTPPATPSAGPSRPSLPASIIAASALTSASRPRPSASNSVNPPGPLGMSNCERCRGARSGRLLGRKPPRKPRPGVSSCRATSTRLH